MGNKESVLSDLV